MKATDPRDNSWGRPTFDSFNLGVINLDSLFRDNITNKDNLSSKELTLLKFSIQCLTACCLKT